MSNSRLLGAVSDTGLSLAELAYRTTISVERLRVIQRGYPKPFDPKLGALRAPVRDKVIAQRQKYAAEAALAEAKPSKREARAIAAACETDVYDIWPDFDSLPEPDAPAKIRPWPYELWPAETIARRLYDLERVVEKMKKGVRHAALGTFDPENDE